MKLTRTLVGVALLFFGIGLGVMAHTIVNANSQGAEVRVNAKRLADGRTEFAVQHRVGNDWERLTPSGRYLPANPRVGVWLNSTPVTITTPAPAQEQNSSTVRLDGSGQDGGTIRLSQGQWWCDASVQGNGGRYGNGTNFIVILHDQYGGQALVANKIAERGTWGKLVPVHSPVSVVVEVSAEGSWTVECTRQ